MDSENKMFNGATQNNIVQGLCWIQRMPSRTVQQQPKERRFTETALWLLPLKVFSWGSLASIG